MVSDQAALDLAVVKVALILISGIGVMGYLIHVAAKIAWIKPEQRGVSSYTSEPVRLESQGSSVRSGETTASPEDL
jgi:hypothetical protein